MAHAKKAGASASGANAQPRASATFHARKRRQQSAPLTVSRPELLAGRSDREFRRLVHNFFAFAQRHEQVRAGHAARIGLSGVEYTVLIAIRHLADEGDVSVKLLAEHLHFSGAFATTMVGKLIARGLVAKEQDPADKRRVKLEVSARGHELLAGLASVQRRVNDVQFGPLAAGEMRILLDLLERLIAAGDQAVALQGYLALSDAPMA